MALLPVNCELQDINNSEFDKEKKDVNVNGNLLPPINNKNQENKIVPFDGFDWSTEFIRTS